MRDISTLNLLPVGGSATVVSLENQSQMRRRLLDMGLTQQTTVECLGRSPSGDPSAYLIRGAVIAIRTMDSQNILVAPC